jgi:hypothetical protein
MRYADCFASVICQYQVGRASMFVRRQATALVLFKYEHNRATAFPPCEMSSLKPKGTSLKTIICLLYKGWNDCNTWRAEDCSAATFVQRGRLLNVGWPKGCQDLVGGTLTPSHASRLILMPTCGWRTNGGCAYKPILCLWRQYNDLHW